MPRPLAAPVRGRGRHRRRAARSRVVTASEVTGAARPRSPAARPAPALPRRTVSQPLSQKGTSREMLTFLGTPQPASPCFRSPCTCCPPQSCQAVRSDVPLSEVSPANPEPSLLSWGRPGLHSTPRSRPAPWSAARPPPALMAASSGLVSNSFPQSTPRPLRPRLLRLLRGPSRPGPFFSRSHARTTALPVPRRGVRLRKRPRVASVLRGALLSLSLSLRLPLPRLELSLSLK